MINDSEIIYPLHPVLEKNNYTINYDECYQKSIIIGINPQTLAGILTGRIRPNSLIIQRLKKIFPSDIVDELVQDYDPFRGIQYSTNINKNNINTKCPIILLSNSDSIRTEDDKWITITKKEVFRNNIRLYSNDILIGVFNKEDTCIAHINKYHTLDNDKNKNIAKMKNELKIFNEDKMSRDLFIDKMLEKYD